MNTPPPTLRSWGAPAAALIAVVAIWAGREVIAIDVLTRLLLPVVWLAVWSLACIGLGGFPVRHLMGERQSEALDIAVVLATGAGLLSLLATLLAGVHALHPAVLIVILGLAALTGAALLATSRLRLALPDLGTEPATLVVLIAAWAGVATLLTAPPVMFDVLNYHLAFPARWLDVGGFVDFPRHAFSYYPSGHGMCYSFALATVGPWGASALHWWFGGIAALAAHALGRHLGGPRAGWWAMVLFALTPAALEAAGYATADLAVAAWGGAALVVLLAGRPRSSRWALAGALVGAAVTAKYLALATVALPVAVAALVIALRHPRNTLVRPILALVITAAAIASPWFVRNTLWTGNPLYPYAQAVLGGPASAMDLGSELQRNHLPEAGPVLALWRAAVAVPLRSVSPVREGGVLGLQWVILLPVALFLRNLRSPPWLPVAAAMVTGVLAWGVLVNYARFLLPILVPAAAVAGATAAALTTLESTTLRRVFHALLLALLAWNVTSLATGLNVERLGVVTGKTTAEDFLDTWVGYAPALAFVDTGLPEDATLLLVGESRSLYIRRQVLVEDPFRLPWLLELAEQARDADELAEMVHEIGATHILVNEGHFPWAASLRGAESYWSGASDPARHRAAEFLEARVDRLFTAGGVWIGGIRGYTR